MTSWKTLFGLLPSVAVTALIWTGAHAQAPTLDCGKDACVALSAFDLTSQTADPAAAAVTDKVQFTIAYRFLEGSYAFNDPTFGVIGARLDLDLPEHFAVEPPPNAAPWTVSCVNVPANGQQLTVWHRHCTWIQAPFVKLAGDTNAASVGITAFGQPYEVAVDALSDFSASVTTARNGSELTHASLLQLEMLGQGQVALQYLASAPVGYRYVFDGNGQPVLGRAVKLDFTVADGTNPGRVNDQIWVTDSSPDPDTLDPLLQPLNVPPWAPFRWGDNQVDQVQVELTLPEYAMVSEIHYFDPEWGTEYYDPAPPNDPNHQTPWSLSGLPASGELGGTLTFGWSGALGNERPMEADGSIYGSSYGPYGVYHAFTHRIAMVLVVPCDQIAAYNAANSEDGQIDVTGRERRPAANGPAVYQDVSTHFPPAARAGSKLLGGGDLWNNGQYTLAACGVDGATPTYKHDDSIPFLGYVAPSGYLAPWDVRFSLPGGVRSFGPTQVVDVIPPYATLNTVVAYHDVNQPGWAGYSADHTSFETWYCKLPRTYVPPPSGVVCAQNEDSASCARGLPRSHHYETPDPGDFDLDTQHDGSTYLAGHAWAVGWNQALGAGCVQETDVWLPPLKRDDQPFGERLLTYEPADDPGTGLRLDAITHIFLTTGAADWRHPLDSNATPHQPDELAFRYSTFLDVRTTQPDMIGASPGAYAAIENSARIAGAEFVPYGQSTAIPLGAYVSQADNKQYKSTVSAIDPVDDRPPLEPWISIGPGSSFAPNDSDGAVRVGFGNNNRGVLRNLKLEVTLPEGFEPAPIDPGVFNVYDSNLRLPDGDGLDVTIPGLGVVAGNLLLMKDQFVPGPDYAAAWSALETDAAAQQRSAFGPGGVIDVAIAHQQDGRWHYTITLPQGSEMKQGGAYSNGGFVIGAHPIANYPFVNGQAYDAHVKVTASNYDKGFDGTVGTAADFEVRDVPAYVTMNQAVEARVEPDCVLSQLQPAFRVRYRNTSGVHQYGVQSWFTVPAEFAGRSVTFDGLEESSFPVGATNRSYEVSYVGDGSTATADEVWQTYVPATHDGTDVKVVRIAYGTAQTAANRLTAWSEGSFIVRFDLGSLILEDIAQNLCATSTASISTTTLPTSTSQPSDPYCVGMCGVAFQVSTFHDLGGTSGVQDGNDPALGGWQVQVNLSGGTQNAPQGLQPAVTADANGIATVIVYPGQTATLVDVPPAAQTFDTGEPAYPGALGWTGTTPGIFGVPFAVGLEAPADVEVGELCACTTDNLCTSGGPCVTEGGTGVDDYTCDFPEAPTCPSTTTDDCFVDKCDPTTGQCATFGFENCHPNVAVTITLLTSPTLTLGGSATWTLSVTNTSALPLTDVSANVTLPPGFTSNDPTSWTGLTLAAGETVAFTVTAAADSCIALGTGIATGSGSVALDSNPTDDSSAASPVIVIAPATDCGSGVCGGTGTMECEDGVPVDTCVETTEECCGALNGQAFSTVYAFGPVTSSALIALQTDPTPPGSFAPGPYLRCAIRFSGNVGSVLQTPLTGISCAGIVSALGPSSCATSSTQVVTVENTQCVPGGTIGWSLVATPDVLVCGAMNGPNDIGGSLAVRGDLSLDGFSIGYQLEPVDGPGGDPQAQDGPEPYGVLWVGGTFTGRSGTVWGDGWASVLDVDDTVTFGEGGAAHATNPYDFENQCAKHEAMSTSLGQLAPSGAPITVTPWGDIELAGTDPTLNVFWVDAGDFDPVQTSLYISAPVGSTVLVNVFGTSGQLTGGGIYLTGVDAAHVLFNLPEATSFAVNQMGLFGSLLAPFAAVDYRNGFVDGTLVAGSLTGDVEHHIGAFAATIDGPCEAP